MSFSTFHAISLVCGIAVLVALAAAILSLAFMVFRWRTPRRNGHAVRLLLSLAAIPCLIGIQQAVQWLIFLPALGRQQMAEIDAARARQYSESSLVQIGDPMPDFVVTDADGATFSIHEARGKVIVISFFATWCGPCIAELPHIDKIWKKHRDVKRFQLLVIGREESMDSVRGFRATNGYSFPIAADPDRKIYSLVAKELIPRTIVVSGDGVIVYSKIGFYEEDLNELRTVLAEQIARQP